MNTQGGNVRKHSRLIEKAKMFMHHEKLNQEKVPINRNQPKGKKPNRKSLAAQEMPIGPDGKPMTKDEVDLKKQEDEAIQAFYERQDKLQRIQDFKFDIDNDLEVEILTSD